MRGLLRVYVSEIRPMATRGLGEANYLRRLWDVPGAQAHRVQADCQIPWTQSDGPGSPSLRTLQYYYISLINLQFATFCYSQGEILGMISHP